MLNNQSSNFNNQISPNYQIPITKHGKFGKLVIGSWLLVGAWCLVLGALTLGFLCGCENQRLHKDTQLLMGTFVQVVSPDPRAAGIVFAEIGRIEGLLSKYKPDSEIARLNNTGRLQGSPETLYIIKKAGEFWQASGGAFDITVGPLVDLWGFSDKKYRLPSEAEIRETLKLVGFDKIIINEPENMIQFKTLGSKVDLGGIAKGYALDCAVKKLKENNVTSCLINAGGQVYCLGDRFGRPWRVAVKSGRLKGYLSSLELKDQGVSTSGDYEQYFIKARKRYSHILDPRTGYPADSGIISAVVVADDNLTADALSTAIFVLGKEKGRQLTQRFPGAEIKIIEEQNAQNNR